MAKWKIVREKTNFKLYIMKVFFLFFKAKKGFFIETPQFSPHAIHEPGMPFFPNFSIQIWRILHIKKLSNNQFC